MFLILLNSILSLKTFIFRERDRERERETLMCERNIDLLLLTCPQPGTWTATQACALTRNRTGDLLGLQDDAQLTEPHQSGLNCNLENS